MLVFFEIFFFFGLSSIFPHLDENLFLKQNNKHSDFDTHFPEMCNVAQ